MLSSSSGDSSILPILSKLNIRQRIALLSTLLRLRIRSTLSTLQQSIFMQEAVKPRSARELSQAEQEQLINIVAQSKWARHIAEGQARFAGLVPGSHSYEEFVGNYARGLARRMLGL